MSSFLRIIVTGLIAQDPLTGGFLEDGFIKRTEDRPTTIGLPRTAPSTLPVSPHHGAIQPGRRPSLRAPAEVWFSISDSQRKQILNFADLLLNLWGSGMERRTPASPPARIHRQRSGVHASRAGIGKGELRDAVQLKAVGE
jgi:hypothetical protein